jgi:CspA family cold shock protein
MTTKQIFSTAILVIAVLVGLFTARSMAGAVGMAPIAMLFFAGVGAGMSLRGLRGRRSAIGLATASQTAEPRRRNSRTKSRNRGRGQGQGQGQGQAQGGKKKSRATGVVKWFDDTKGFGFITPDNGDKDCFVHRSAIQGGTSVAEGKRVEFHVVTDEKGRQAAANVVRI